MSFKVLYEHVNALRSAPIIIETHVVPIIKAHTSQDEIYFAKVELDTDISLGHIKQYREHAAPYAEPKWVSQIRYSNALNRCWMRFVCCKELMHTFDAPNERADTDQKWRRLLSDLESEPMYEDASPMYITERRATWMALATLCPLSLRDHYREKMRSDGMSPYEVALALRIPEGYVPTAMSERHDQAIESLLED